MLLRVITPPGPGAWCLTRVAGATHWIEVLADDVHAAIVDAFHEQQRE